MKTAQLLILLISILLYSCSSKEAERTAIARLHDIWALETIEGKKIEFDESVNELPRIEIYVKDERVYGNTGCNSFNGKIEIDDNRITFKEIIATEMACPGDLEERFLSALQVVNNYKREKMRLFLYNNEKEKLVFRKID